MIKLDEIYNKKIWENFFNQNGSPSFLQSWTWAEFEKEIGYNYQRLGIFNNNKLIAICLVIHINSKRGNFFFIPHGPIFKKDILEDLKTLKLIISKIIQYLKRLSNKNNVSFIRVSPILEFREDYLKIFTTLKFKIAPIYMHAETVWILPLEKYKNEEEILKQMRKTTRYLINKAIKDKIIVEKRLDKKSVDDFWKIYKKTAEREKFTPFSKEFIKKEFETFNKNNQAIFLFSRLKNNKKYLASALIIFTKSTGFYHQGASIHTKFPVTYLLQWEAIKETKNRNCKNYNFWGILRPNRTPKSWNGLTFFKTGFGGRKIDYLPTLDYVVNFKYYFTYFYEKFLAWKRGI